MDSNNTVVIISGIMGLISGTIASFSAPWIKWGIEKRKMRHLKRAELIHEIRELVQKDSYTKEIFRETGIYSQIRPFLDKALIKEIEKSSKEITVDIGDGRGSGVKEYNTEILDNLSLLEKKWKLI